MRTIIVYCIMVRKIVKINFPALSVPTAFFLIFVCYEFRIFVLVFRSYVLVLIKSILTNFNAILKLSFPAPFKHLRQMNYNFLWWGVSKSEKRVDMSTKRKHEHRNFEFEELNRFSETLWARLILTTKRK